MVAGMNSDSIGMRNIGLTCHIPQSAFRRRMDQSGMPKSSIRATRIGAALK
jgi:hypothetical protein